MLTLPRFLRAALPVLAPRLPANAADQQERLRDLVRLPHISSDFGFNYTILGGCLSNTNVEIARDTLESLRKTLRGDAEDALIHYNIGYLCAMAGKRADAKAAYLQSATLYQEQVESVPDDGARRAYLLIALHQAQRRAERDVAMADALIYTPNHPLVWIVRAQIAFAEVHTALSGQAEYVPAPDTLYRLAMLLKRSWSKAKISAALE